MNVPELTGEAIVVIVVPWTAAGFAAAAAELSKNEPTPHRHWQSHAPLAWTVPAPDTMAPGEPTARAATKVY